VEFCTGAFSFFAFVVWFALWTRQADKKKQEEGVSFDDVFDVIISVSRRWRSLSLENCRWPDGPNAVRTYCHILTRSN